MSRGLQTTVFILMQIGQTMKGNTQLVLFYGEHSWLEDLALNRTLEIYSKIQIIRWRTSEAEIDGGTSVAMPSTSSGVFLSLRWYPRMIGLLLVTIVFESVSKYTLFTTPMR